MTRVLRVSGSGNAERPMTPSMLHKLETRRFWLAQARSLLVRAADVLKDQGEDDLLEAVTPIIGKLEERA